MQVNNPALLQCPAARSHSEFRRLRRASAILMEIQIALILVKTAPSSENLPCDGNIGAWEGQ